MTKNPFEVRLDLLSMAKDMLEVEYTANRDVYLAQVKGNEGVITSEMSAPAYFTTADVIDKANELYSFVNDRSSTGSQVLNESKTTVVERKSKK